MAEVSVMDQGNTRQMRIILWETIEGIRSGKSSPAAANAISNASGKWLGTIKLDLEYQKLIGKTPNIAALVPAEDTPTQK